MVQAVADGAPSAYFLIGRMVLERQTSLSRTLRSKHDFDGLLY